MSRAIFIIGGGPFSPLHAAALHMRRSAGRRAGFGEIHFGPTIPKDGIVLSSAVKFSDHGMPSTWQPQTKRLTISYGIFVPTHGGPTSFAGIRHLIAPDGALNLLEKHLRGRFHGESRHACVVNFPGKAIEWLDQYPHTETAVVFPMIFADKTLSVSEEWRELTSRLRPMVHRFGGGFVFPYARFDQEKPRS